LFILKKIFTDKATFSAVKNTFWLIGEKIFSMVLVLTVSVFVARYLGVESFGLLNYLIAIVALFSPLSSLGLNAIITREIINKSHSELIIMSTVITYRLIGGFCAIIILITMLWFGFFYQLQTLAWGLILLAFINVFVAFHAIDFWFQAKVKSKYVVKMRFCCILFMSLFKLCLVYIEAPFSWFIWITALESLFISLGFLVIYLCQKNRLKFYAINWRYGITLLKQSKWLIFSGVAAVIYLKIDQVMLTEMVSAKENGIYSVASRLSEVWYFFPTALVASFFPSLLNAKKLNNDIYQHKLQRLCDFLLLGAVIIAGLITFVADDLIIFLYGSEYAAAGIILTIHIWASLFVFMRSLLSKWLLAENLVVFSLITHGIGAVVNVCLNYWLIPLYQGQGAAVATVISYAFASYVVLFFHRSTWPMAKVMSKSFFFPSRMLLSRVKSPP
jgi:PST family polysaccharide transporter